MPTRILIEGLGDVAPVAQWSQTELQAGVMGGASPGFIVIRDLGASPTDFITGKRVTVDRGPGTDPIWAGYLLRANRRFWFDVDNPDTLQRQWRLAVADIGLLFSRRVVHKVSDPETVTGPKYTSNVYDDDVIDELVTNWLDLSADDIDVTSRVSRVAHINAGQTTYPWNGGMTWEQAMDTISQLPAAVYGIDPQRRLVYSDVDDENAPFVLSDVPVPGRDVAGYREMRIVDDGSKLINDVLCWGFGHGGGPNGVFERLESTTSQDLHGLWQDAITSFQVWKQATIEKIADSIINGSPTSHRGYKNDQTSVECVTFRDGLAAGDRVRFISSIWDYDDVLPVRKMTLTFPTPDDVRYKLFLSHEVDRWGLADPMPPIKGVLTPPIDIPIIDIEIPVPDVGEPGCSDEVCGITDGFGRVDAFGWGNSDAGPAWELFGTGSVDGTKATLGGEESAKLYPLPAFTDVTVTVQLDAAGSGRTVFLLMTDEDTPATRFIEVDFRNDGQLNLFDGNDVVGVFTTLGWGPATETNIRLVVSGGVADAYVWQATDPMPGSPTLSITDSSPLLYPDHEWKGAWVGSHGGSGYEVYFRNLDAVGADRCSTGQFDDFNNRTLTGIESWGTASGGGVWTSTETGATADQIEVAGGYGKLEIKDVTFGRAVEVGMLAPPPYLHRTQDIAMRAKFRTNVVTGADNQNQLTFELWGAVVQLGLVLDNSNGIIFIQNAGFDFVAKTDWVADSWYLVKWEQPWAGLARVKVWLATDPEPSGWDLEVTKGAPSASQDYFLVDFDGGGGGDSVGVVLIDYIEFDYEGKPCFIEPHCNYEDWDGVSIPESGTDMGGDPAWDMVIGDGTGVTVIDNSIVMEGTNDVHAFEQLVLASHDFFADLNLPLDITFFYSMTEPAPDDGSGPVSSVSVKFAVTWLGGTEGGGGLEVELMVYHDVFDDEYKTKAIFTSNGATTEVEESGNLLADGELHSVALSLGGFFRFVDAGGSLTFLDSSHAGHTGTATTWVKFYIGLTNQSNSGFPGGVGPGDEETLVAGIIQIGQPGDGNSWCGGYETPPSEGGDAPDGPVGDEVATRISSTLYRTEEGYRPGTLIVFVNGDIQRVNIDFTETNYITGDFTFASALDPSDVVQVQYEDLI